MGISVKAEIARKNFRYKDIAKKVNMAPSTFYRRLESNSFSIDEVERIFSAIGVKLVITE